jgi:hypothetical protein
MLTVMCLRQQTEYGDAVGSPHIDAPVRDHGRDEFIARKVVATVGSLVRVIQLISEIGCVVSVQHGGSAIFDDPDDPSGGKVCRNAWRGSGIPERCEVWDEGDVASFPFAVGKALIASPTAP